MIRLGSGLLAVLAAIAVARGCDEDTPPPRADEVGTLGDPAATVEAGSPMLGAVASEPVQGWTGPGGEDFRVALRSTGSSAHLYRRFGVRPYGIALRDSAVARQPCGTCHAPDGTTATTERVEDAHGDITVNHPAATAAACTTCHASHDVERLALESGDTVTFDHAYRLCGRCHNPQVEAWAGGAHGKRLDVWRGDRVLMGCGDCHDPHDPGLEKRIPYPGPRIPRTGRGR